MRFLCFIVSPDSLRLTKEIGIRKVMGANVLDIVTLLSKDFLLLVVIAALVATPLAWWAMNNWLEDFTYRVNIQWWVFAVVLVMVVLAAIITIGFQAIKAAVANPVKRLKNEGAVTLFIPTIDNIAHPYKIIRITS